MKQTIFPRAKTRMSLSGKKGFTLVELLISFAILILVFTIVYQFFNFSGNMFRKTDNLAAEQDQARLMVLGLRRDLGMAAEILEVTYQTLDDNLNNALPEGYLALFMDDGRLAKMNDDDDIEYIYSSASGKNLFIRYTSTETVPYILHVSIVVNVDGDIKELASTDLYFRNIEEEGEEWFTVPDPDDPDAITPNTIIYKPGPIDTP